MNLCGKRDIGEVFDKSTLVIEYNSFLCTRVLPLPNPAFDLHPCPLLVLLSVRTLPLFVH